MGEVSGVSLVIHGMPGVMGGDDHVYTAFGHECTDRGPATVALGQGKSRQGMEPWMGPGIVPRMGPGIGNWLAHGLSLAPHGGANFKKIAARVTKIKRRCEG